MIVQWLKALASKPNNLSSLGPGTHMMEGENHVPKVVL